MLFLLIPAVILCIIAGIAKSVMDTIVFRTESKLPDTIFWDGKLSGNLKYKLVDGQKVPNTKRLWYCLWLVTPKYVEKFPYSTTLLVGFTDAWHAFQFAHTISHALAFTLLGIVATSFSIWFILAAFPCAYYIERGTFHLFFHHVLNKQ